MVTNNLVKDLIDISDVETYPKQLLNFLEYNSKLFLEYSDAECYFMELRDEDIDFSAPAPKNQTNCNRNIIMSC